LDSKKVLIKFMDDENRWRIFWSCTTELADPRSFATIDEAAPVARALMGRRAAEAWTRTQTHHRHRCLIRLQFAW